MNNITAMTDRDRNQIIYYCEFVFKKYLPEDSDYKIRSEFDAYGCLCISCAGWTSTIRNLNTANWADLIRLTRSLRGFAHNIAKGGDRNWIDVAEPEEKMAKHIGEYTVASLCGELYDESYEHDINGTVCRADDYTVSVCVRHDGDRTDCRISHLESEDGHITIVCDAEDDE